jgi:hypothetical protein
VRPAALVNGWIGCVQGFSPSGDAAISCRSGPAGRAFVTQSARSAGHRRGDEQNVILWMFMDGLVQSSAGSGEFRRQC